MFTDMVGYTAPMQVDERLGLGKPPLRVDLPLLPGHVFTVDLPVV